MRRVSQSSLPWKSFKYSLLLCVCVHACGCPDASACACAYVRVAVLIQHAMHMRHIVTSFVTFQSPSHFSTVFHGRCDFRKKVTEHKMCVLSFSTTSSKKFLIIRRIQRDIVINVETSSCKVHVILVDFN